MENSKKSFNELFRKEWNREGLNRAFTFPYALVCAVILGINAVTLIAAEIKEIFAWFEKVGGMDTEFSMKDCAFIASSYYNDGKNIRMSFSAFGLDRLIGIVCAVIVTLVFALFVLSALRRVGGGLPVITDEQTEENVRIFIRRNRKAKAAAFLAAGPFAVCTALVYESWDGIYLSMIKHIQLMERYELANLYFIIGMIIFLFAAASSVSVYSLIGRVYRDETEKGTGEILRSRESFAKVCNIALAVFILAVPFVLMVVDIMARVFGYNTFDGITYFIYPALFGVLVLLLNRYRSVQARSCTVIAYEREKAMA